METWRGTGRRALAVGAGALLIGALGAGPAYAGSDNNDDDYVHVDDSCGDYHYSWYYEHGYDYDENWDDDGDHGDHDRWDKDRWDHGKDWHQGDDWKKHWDDKDFYVKDGKVYDKKTDKPIFDLGTGLPIDVKSNDVPIQGSGPNKTTSTTDDQVAQAPGTETAPAQRKQSTSSTEQAAPTDVQPEPVKPEVIKPEVIKPEPVTPPSSESTTPSSVATDESGTTSSVKVKPNAVVTDLAATDPWDDKGKDHDGDKDWNKDRDHHWWDGWWQKESYSVDVSCYEDKETHHRWYDNRPVGKVEATEVKTVPTGGVDTGN